MKWNITHGDSYKNFYSRWIGMKRRCSDKVFKDYARYGKKGIGCSWKSYEDFKQDMHRSFLSHVKKHGRHNTTIDRIDSLGPYSKINCRWATIQKQALNRRTNKFLTIGKKRKTYVEWSRIIGCSRQALRYRIMKGLRPDLIRTLPFRKSNKYANFV